MIVEGWDSLRTVEPQTRKTQQDNQDDIDRLYLRVFGSEDGQKLHEHLRSLTIEQPTWYPGEDASHTVLLGKGKIHLSAK